MKRETSWVATALALCTLVTVVAIAGPAVVPARERPISAEETAAIAVSDLTQHGASYHLRQPPRQVDFMPEGVRLEGLRGAPEWTWRLEQISSAGGRLVAAGGAVAPVALELTLIRYDRCVVYEDYRLKQDSVEQLLVVPEPLPLDGEDLVVTGAVSCTGKLSEEETGWTWRGPRGEVTLGRVRVLDAEGNTLPARLEVTATSTRLVVDGAALLAAAYPVVVDPELGSNDYRISDMGPDGDWEYGGAEPAVAYNTINDTYLVVWEGDDNTGGLVDDEREIFGQLLDSRGTEIGDNDVRISYAGGTGSPVSWARSPDVAFNSNYNEFLVVWSADNPEDGCVDEEFEIWGQVVDASLNPVFGGNFRISFNGGSGDSDFDAYLPAVTYNPEIDEYLVVWQADDTVQGMVDGEDEIFAQRVYSTGVLVGSNLRMSDMGGSGDPGYDAHMPDVVYNSRGNEYLIVWEGDDNTGGLVDGEYEIFGQLVTWELVGTGPNDFRLSDMGGTGDPAYSGCHPSAAYNARRNEYLVVWVGDDNVGGLVDGDFEVFSQRFTPDIVGLGPNDFRLSDVGGIGDPNYHVVWGPEIAYSPILDQYMVVWGGEDNVGGMVDNEWEIFAQMLNGNVTDGIGPNDERISDAGGIGQAAYFTYSPVVAADTWNGEFLVAWSGEDNVGTLVQWEYEVFIQRMDGMAILVDAFESDDTSRWSSSVP
jgi:hypothetical protein